MASIKQSEGTKVSTITKSKTRRKINFALMRNFARSFIWHNHYGMWVKEMEVSPAPLLCWLLSVSDFIVFLRQFWVFLISLICIFKKFNWVCWTRDRNGDGETIWNWKIIEIGVDKGKWLENYFEFAFHADNSARANDGESSQNRLSTNRFSLLYTRLNFLTELPREMFQNWVKESCASDVMLGWCGTGES